MRRLLLPAVLALVLLPSASAEAVTIRDIVDLTRAGVGDEILLALIEVDGGVFSIDTETLTMLKREGVSERVIVAMVRSGRNRPLDPPPAAVDVVPPPAAPPPVVVIEHHDRQVAVPVAVPVFVPVVQRRGHVFDGRIDGLVHREDLLRRGEQTKPAEPVYWGFGGKLRPDAWKPAPSVEGSGGWQPAPWGRPPGASR
jgi:hypothetical protein